MDAFVSITLQRQFTQHRLLRKQEGFILAFRSGVSRPSGSTVGLRVRASLHLLSLEAKREDGDGEDLEIPFESTPLMT